MSFKPQRIVVYDTETTGLSSHYDQIIQFAGVELTPDLDLIPGREIVLDVKLRPNVVPSPKAFAVHGLSISNLMDKGITEFEAAGHVRNWFLAEPGTLIAGYNSLGFDDEMTRNLMYRNMTDPYEHEYKNGNRRMDVFRLIMLVYALRPELINWPVNEEGKISLKLGDLCAANGIELKHAHDARFDVMATVELMRLVKEKSPRLWSYYLDLTGKDFSKSLAEKMTPLVLVDRYIPREQGHMSIVLPVIYSAKTPNKMLCVDLREDPSELLTLPPDEIRRRMFTSASELGEGEAIIGIRDITTNKQPLVCELNVLKGRDDLLVRSAIDMEKFMKHAHMIQEDKSFRARLQEAFNSEFEPCRDAYEGLYSLGLIGRDEHTQRSRLRRMTSSENGQQHFHIEDINPHDLCTSQVKDSLRMFELALRAKWANFAENVFAKGAYTKLELQEWIAHMDSIWSGEPRGKYLLNYELFMKDLAEVRATHALDPTQEKALLELESYVQANLTMLERLKGVAQNLKSEKAEEDAPEQDIATQKLVQEKERRERIAAEASGPSCG